MNRLFRLLTFTFVLAFVGPSLRSARAGDVPPIVRVSSTLTRTSDRVGQLSVTADIANGFHIYARRSRVRSWRRRSPWPSRRWYASPERSPRRGRRKSSSTQPWGSSSTSTRDRSRGPLPSSSRRSRVPNSSCRGHGLRPGLPRGSLPGPEDVRVQGPSVPIPYRPTPARVRSRRS